MYKYIFEYNSLLRSNCQLDHEFDNLSVSDFDEGDQMKGKRSCCVPIKAGLNSIRKSVIN